MGYNSTCSCILRNDLFSYMVQGIPLELHVVLASAVLFVRAIGADDLAIAPLERWHTHPHQTLPLFISTLCPRESNLINVYPRESNLLNVYTRESNLINLYTRESNLINLYTRESNLINVYTRESNLINSDHPVQSEIA